MAEDPVLALFARWRADIDAEPMPPLPAELAEGESAPCAAAEASGRVRCGRTVRSLRLLLRSARRGRACR